MDSSQTAKLGLFRWAWPSVDTPDAAARATKQAFWAAVLVAGLTGSFALMAAAGVGVVQEIGINTGALVDAGLFAVIALGLWKQSRAAAWAGLALYGFERIYAWSTTGAGSPLIPIIFILAFIGGVRGTAALARMKDAAPAVEFTGAEKVG